MAKMERMGVSDCEDLEKGNCNKVRELKKEFQRLMMEIIDGDDEDEEEGKNETENESESSVILGTIDKAIQALSALKELKLSKTKKPYQSSQLDALDVPDEFRCPISRELMKDPVVLSTGQTYDRPYIQKWLEEGHRTCPQTQQVLSHILLTPNHLVRELIAQWCKDRGIELPPPVEDPNGIITDADRNRLNGLLKKLSSSLSEQKQAAKEIRMLTKRMPSFRSFFCESTDAIPRLLRPLTHEKIDDHPDLQEDLITATLNLSIQDSNKKIIAEHPPVVPLLVQSLRHGTIETRANAAAALFSLSALDSNKHLIGESDALKPLIDLLEEGHPLAMKDAASAIFNLCKAVENRGRAVHDGAVKVILQKIKDQVLVDELLTILALLASHKGGIDELGKLGAVGCLLSIIRESTSEHNRENCIAILYLICLYKRTKLKEVGEEERTNGTISKLAENGNSRAKRKAKDVLDMLRRGINLTHTA